MEKRKKMCIAWYFPTKRGEQKSTTREEEKKNAFRFRDIMPGFTKGAKANAPAAAVYMNKNDAISLRARTESRTLVQLKSMREISIDGNYEFIFQRFLCAAGCGTSHGSAHPTDCHFLTLSI